jgi:sporulation protein YlmC with PRC-barrel domain
MIHCFSPAHAAALLLAGAFCAAGPATAQVAGGSTTVGVSVTESTQLALGWSVKKTLLGKTIYNEQGDKVGEVEDLIIAPDRNVSYVIVGAGGFIGIGQHDVAVPVTQIQNRGGKLVMPGASKDMLKAMPTFAYATDTARRDQFVAAAEADIARGKARITDLEKKAGAAASSTKAELDRQITTLRLDVKSAEGQLSELKQAGEVRWQEFEAGVSAASARLRKSIDSAAG